MKLKTLKTLNSLLLLLLVALPCWGGVDFNGDADYVTLGNVLDLQGSMTFSFWLNMDALPTSGNSRNPVILFKGAASTNGYYIQSNPSGLRVGSIGLRTNQSGDGQLTESIASVIPIGSWQHFAITRNGTSVKIFAGGSEVSYDSQGSHSDPDSSSSDFKIGQYSTVTNGYLMNGKINNISIWDTDLSLEEIRLIYNSKLKDISSQIQPSHLLLDLPLGDHPEGTAIDGLTFKDQSGNGNHGTGVDANDNSLVVGETVLSYPRQVAIWATYTISADPIINKYLPSTIFRGIGNGIGRGLR